MLLWERCVGALLCRCGGLRAHTSFLRDSLQLKDRSTSYGPLKVFAFGHEQAAATTKTAAALTGHLKLLLPPHRMRYM